MPQQEQGLLWVDYNLYDHVFNEELQEVAFSGVKKQIQGRAKSPELTTNGILKKYLRKKEGRIELFKGQTTGSFYKGGKEAFCEYYMTQVAEAMGLNCVEYDLEMHEYDMVSVCTLFTSASVGYVPIMDFLSGDLKDLFRNKKHIETIESYYGVQSLADMMIFDALIVNQDRHLGNYGVLVDNDKQEILAPAPLFDHGRSFFNLILKQDIGCMGEALALKSKGVLNYFGYTFARQVKAFAQEHHIAMLERLRDFTFARHKEHNLDEVWLQAGERFIRERAQNLIKIVETKIKPKLLSFLWRK
ncbi:hypothetical protein [Helicobacter felistomachi]|uniref:hypothetical protein n=1 Tax=Helicobacter felistomachi TaxID=3040201 RepID=UPI002573696F|nr:hypothetical protein [Helicobacter sp. NHP21005]